MRNNIMPDKNDLDTTCINTIRNLSMDAVQWQGRRCRVDRGR
jgi:hypothetical protein